MIWLAITVAYGLGTLIVLACLSPPPPYAAHEGGPDGDPSDRQPDSEGERHVDHRFNHREPR